MFPGRVLAPGAAVAPGAVPANAAGSPAVPAGQPIPTLSAGQAVPQTGVPAQMDPSQGVRAPQVPVMFPGQEVPVFHPAVSQSCRVTANISLPQTIFGAFNQILKQPAVFLIFFLFPSMNFNRKNPRIQIKKFWLKIEKKIKQGVKFIFFKLELKKKRKFHFFCQKK